MININLLKLLQAGVQFGHETYDWNPKMLPYIYCEKNGIHILNLIKSVQYLKLASKYLKLAAKKQKKILFIGTNERVRSLIAQEAKRSNSYYINHRWLGGTLTNWLTVKKQMKKLNNLNEQKLNGTFDLLTKKESFQREKSLLTLTNTFQGIQQMLELPDMVILINQKYDMTAVLECKKLNIPIISLIDSNCNPDLIDIPIPGNDDSLKSIKLILNILTNSIVEGKNN
uniref:30S ribosomal protein S2 n=1 Tax=Nitzschia alba TaxID=2858 RepID=A0A5C0F3M4_NITAL|nr:30S ribosomal protein S2 [Nitzschia alba]QEI59561.1 30S ribosomal protein S2 [Nitzschia alba]